jgi:hypothetical protein
MKTNHDILSADVHSFNKVVKMRAIEASGGPTKYESDVAGLDEAPPTRHLRAYTHLRNLP